MKIIRLNLNHIDRLLDLEEKMYWQGKNWKKLWRQEAKEKFKKFIKDYLTHFPKGCFGLVDNKQIIGAMFLLKTSRVKPIPYLHRPLDYLNQEGKIAYVSFFVVERNKNKEAIARELYQQAEKVALLKFGCETIAVVIYSSPLEEKILKSNNYERVNKQFNWEIYPGYKKPCYIYYYEIYCS